MPDNLSANTVGIFVTRKRNEEVLSENEIKMPGVFLPDKLYQWTCIVKFHKITPGIFIT